MLENRIILVDGNNLSLRAAHASPPLYDPAGVPTGALMTSIRSICKIASQLKPRRVVWVWDGGHSKFRKGLLPTYKQKLKPELALLAKEDDPRSYFHDDWLAQVALLEKYLPLLGIGQLRIKGCEADDIIYRLVKIFRREDFHVTIASSDADFNQLVEEDCDIYNLNKNMVCDGKYVESTFGIKPEQWVEFRAMTGDPSDNIDGVPGVGKVSAAKVIEKYGCVAVMSLDNTLSKIEKIKKYEQAVLDNQALIARNKLLMDLSSLPYEEVPQHEVEAQLNEALSLQPDLKEFWNVCMKHKLATLTQEAASWKAVYNG